MKKEYHFTYYFSLRFLLKVHFLIAALTVGTNSFSQTGHITRAVWLMPGVTYQVTKGLKFSGQYGLNFDLSVNAVYAQAFIKVSKHFMLNPAYLYLHTSPPGTDHSNEHGLMNAFIISLPLKHFLIDNRNIIWNRFRRDTEDFHFYRNRLRITKPIKLKHLKFEVYAFDEAWYFINQSEWTRNRLAAGFSYDIVSWFNVDVSFARQNDKANGKLNLFFIMGTIRLMRKEDK